MKNLTFFFAILISMYGCQQERVQPEAPTTQEDTLKKTYPPRADHRTRHLAAAVDPTPQPRVYVGAIRWPYNEEGALDSQITMIKEDCKQAFHLAFDSSRVVIVCYEPDTVDMFTYPVTEQELSQVRFYLNLYCYN